MISTFCTFAHSLNNFQKFEIFLKARRGVSHESENMFG